MCYTDITRHLGSAWLERRLGKTEVTGSNPVTSTTADKTGRFASCALLTSVGYEGVCPQETSQEVIQDPAAGIRSN